MAATARKRRGQNLEEIALATPIVTKSVAGTLVVRLNKPEKLNAWDRPMRDKLRTLILTANRDPKVKAIVLTGTGERAFCAGQDLAEGKTFDGPRAEEWIEEWRLLYNAIRRFQKPFVMALNGLAAGSAFQVALLGDIRVGHEDSKMGQPEINSGIASVTGPWIMREIIGLARTIDLTLTGRMLEADECYRIGLCQAFRISGRFSVSSATLPSIRDRTKSDTGTPSRNVYCNTIQWIETLAHSRRRVNDHPTDRPAAATPPA